MAAKAPSLRRWLRRPYAKSSGLIVCSSNDTAQARTRHNHGLAFQRGIFEQVDRGVERVGVDMRDDATGHTVILAAAAPRQFNR